MRIIAVEDEVILLKHMTNRIHEAVPGAEILAFDNTDDALAVLPEKKPDIAFLDIEIGDMNGVDLAKHIKALYPACDIVFCTGYSDYAAQAFDLGASDYLMKPVTKEKIEHALSLLRHDAVRDDRTEKLYIRCFAAMIDGFLKHYCLSVKLLFNLLFTHAILRFPCHRLFHTVYHRKQ